MSSVRRISPERLRYKLEAVDDLQAPVWPGDWDLERRMRLDTSDKYVAVTQRYVEGRRWEDTDLFRNIYQVRFARGETVRGCDTIEALAEQYYTRVDGLYDDLKQHGFLERIDGTPVPIPDVYVARDGELFMGNAGNHRVAMAKVLGLPFVLVNVRTRHPMASAMDGEAVTLHPVLPSEANDLPAMTTRAEQMTGYELAKAHASQGAIVELGAWMGAMTVYLAAGVRDAGVGRVHSHDRFVWKPVHTIKAGRSLDRPMVEQFRANLGPLAQHVEIHAGDFRDATWDGSPISLLVLDGPKRTREITRTLPIFGSALFSGSRILWQDFAHFPSYELVTVLTHLETDGAVRFERGVFPGTTIVTEALRPITASDVTAERLRLERWTPERIESTWAQWATRLPAGARPRFRCGAALFLCSLGHTDRGVMLWRQLIQDHPAEIVPKWQFLRQSDSRTIKDFPDLDREVPR